MTEAIYEEHGINWIWYLKVRHHADSVEILKHWRQHKFDDPNHPKAIGGFEIIESKDGQRIALQVRTHTKKGIETYNVSNPLHVFDYEG